MSNTLNGWQIFALLVTPIITAYFSYVEGKEAGKLEGYSRAKSIFTGDRHANR